VVMTWPVEHNTGWGVFSRALLRQMLRPEGGGHTPLLTVPLLRTAEMRAAFSLAELNQLQEWQELLYRWLSDRAAENPPHPPPSGAHPLQVALAARPCGAPD
jgi:hypothetical protein